MAVVLRFSRTISGSAVNGIIIAQLRNMISNDLAANKSTEDNAVTTEMFAYTFSLPDVAQSPATELQTALYGALVDHQTLLCLELTKHLNWWYEAGVCQRLYPMITSGDGNCLLHAASLAMWGFHDRQLALRKAVHAAMSGSHCDVIKGRWRYQTNVTNHLCGLELTEEEWDKEWSYVLKIASAQPKPNNTAAVHIKQDVNGGGVKACAVFQVTYEYLEEVHVYILSNVLRRPIIVTSKSFLTDSTGDAVAPIPFGGIYLPLDRKPSECKRNPLLLTYNDNHFTALVPMEREEDGKLLGLADAIPLVNDKLELMPIHFIYDPSGCDTAATHQVIETKEEQIALLSLYLDCVQLEMNSNSSSTSNISSSSTTDVLCAKLLHEKAFYVEEMLENFMKTRTLTQVKKIDDVSPLSTIVASSTQTPSVQKNSVKVEPDTSPIAKRKCFRSIQSHLPKRSSFLKLFRSKKEKPAAVVDTVIITPVIAVKYCNVIGCRGEATAEMNNKCRICYSEFAKNAASIKVAA